MTQEQYLTLKKHRATFDLLAQHGSWRSDANTIRELDQVRRELFQTNTNWWCGDCVKEALYQLYSAYDQYEAASAPVIVTSDKSAEVEIGRNTKAANKRKRD